MKTVFLSAENSEELRVSHERLCGPARHDMYPARVACAWALGQIGIARDVLNPARLKVQKALANKPN